MDPDQTRIMYRNPVHRVIDRLIADKYITNTGRINLAELAKPYGIEVVINGSEIPSLYPVEGRLVLDIPKEPLTDDLDFHIASQLYRGIYAFNTPALHLKKSGQSAHYWQSKRFAHAFLEVARAKAKRITGKVPMPLFELPIAG